MDKEAQREAREWVDEKLAAAKLLTRDEARASPSKKKPQNAQGLLDGKRGAGGAWGRSPSSSITRMDCPKFHSRPS